LSVSAEFAEPVFKDRLTNVRLFQMAIFFSDPPAHIEPRKVAGSQRSHGHSEVGERLVNRNNPGAFFDKELSLAAVWMKHAIAHKTTAVANQYANLAECFRQLHTCGDHFL
jgi:hypothetical protein